jgi:hypothetical protein
MRQANEVEDFDIITSDVFGPGNNDFSGANMTGATERAFVRATDRQLEELRETIAAAPEELALGGLVQSIPVRHSDLIKPQKPRGECPGLFDSLVTGLEGRKTVE